MYAPASFINGMWIKTSYLHKLLTNVEYRAVSIVFQNIDPPPPSPPSECVLPSHQRRGVHTRRAVRGGGGSIFRKTRDIGLASYSIISLRLSLSICLSVWRRYKSKFALSVRDEWEADRHAHLSMGEAETRLPGPELYLRHDGTVFKLASWGAESWGGIHSQNIARI